MSISWAAALPSRHNSSSTSQTATASDTCLQHSHIPPSSLLSLARTPSTRSLVDKASTLDESCVDRDLVVRHTRGRSRVTERRDSVADSPQKRHSMEESRATVTFTETATSSIDPNAPTIVLDPPEIRIQPPSSVVGLDRSQWKKMALQRNPAIQELRERVFPIHRAAMFVELHQPNVAAEDESVMRECFLQLVMQAFHYYGFNESLHTLERECGFHCTRERFIPLECPDGRSSFWQSPSRTRLWKSANCATISTSASSKPNGYTTWC